MTFDFKRNTKSIKNIYDDFSNQKLIIDNSYQRRKVWLLKDKIRLIETVLLNLVIPEIFLWQADIDPDTGDSITHIVDGQQRINSIIDFIDGRFKLQKKYLVKKDQDFEDLTFRQLTSEQRKAIWSYDMSIVNIDRKCTIDDIKEMFYRLNLTDYSLNDQEKRNSQDSVFGDASIELANNDFWAKHKVFSAATIRRMNDVEYCSNILILAREGIVDQTSNKILNQIYDDLKESYPERKEDKQKVLTAMEIIDKFTNEKTSKFISKKIQLYSMFCLAFSLMDKKMEITQEMINNFTMFVDVYDKFNNSVDLTFEDEIANIFYDNIKKYKLASSEGVNKITNRMIRYEILSKICTDDQKKIKDAYELVFSKLKI